MKMIASRALTKTLSISSRLLLAAALGATLLLIGAARPAQAQAETGSLVLTQTAIPDPVVVGQPLTYTLVLTNNSATQHAGLKDFLPPGVAFVSASPSQGWCAQGHKANEIVCPLGVIPSGSSATVTVVGVPTVAGPITNAATFGGEFTAVEVLPLTVTALETQP